VVTFSPNTGQFSKTARVREKMSKVKIVGSPIYTFFPNEVDGFDALGELALDMRWSWNHEADEVRTQIDPDLWDLMHNPWVVLKTVSQDRLQQALDDPLFRRKVDDQNDEGVIHETS
jgi:starch phosphorylase